MTHRTKIALGAGLLALAAAVVWNCSFRAEPAVTMGLVSYTIKSVITDGVRDVSPYETVTLCFTNSGRFPVLCEAPVSWIVTEAYPAARSPRSLNSYTFTLDELGVGQIVAVRPHAFLYGLAATDRARFEVRCFRVHGSFRRAVESLLSDLGVKVTNRWYTVSLELPPR